MIDNFALAVSHGLILLAIWRLFSRPDLDDESASNALTSEPGATPKARAGA